MLSAKYMSADTTCAGHWEDLGETARATATLYTGGSTYQRHHGPHRQDSISSSTTCQCYGYI
eukprot:m.595566 g.595566  ORF g.595566 m.595566 type:complete len:62 (+) comp22406_c0_seq1:1243-1428(+)